MLLPHDIDTKLGRLVMEVLHEKHLVANKPQASDLPNLGAPPPIPPVVIGATVVKEVTNQMLGPEGLSGFDFVMAQSWLLFFGTALKNLPNAFAKLATWMASKLTP